MPLSAPPSLSTRLRANWPNWDPTLLPLNPSLPFCPPPPPSECRRSHRIWSRRHSPSSVNTIRRLSYFNFVTPHVQLLSLVLKVLVEVVADHDKPSFVINRRNACENTCLSVDPSICVSQSLSPCPVSSWGCVGAWADSAATPRRSKSRRVCPLHGDRAGARPCHAARSGRLGRLQPWVRPSASTHSTILASRA
jgi:hypothetical protein